MFEPHADHGVKRVRDACGDEVCVVGLEAVERLDVTGGLRRVCVRALRRFRTRGKEERKGQADSEHG